MIPSRQSRIEIAVAAALIILSGVTWLSVSELPPPFFDPIGSAAFPKAMAVIIAALSLVVIAKAVLASRSAPAAEAEPSPEARQSHLLGAAMYALVILYAAAMQWKLLGFATATALFIVAAGAVLGRFRLKETIVSAVLALLLGFGGDYLFTHVFYIDLPA